MSKSSSRSHGYTTTSRDEPPVPEPTYAERVRTLISRAHMGTLSTLSAKHPDWPFGSMMPYGLDEKGRPTFLISTMAMHTHNLIRDGRSSLFVSQTDSGGDPLDASRVTLMGETTKVPDEQLHEVRDLYLKRYKNASYWVDFDDFSFYRMDIKDIYFVGGFGAMGWVTVEQYHDANVDPLADSAAGIIKHMNDDHTESLVLLAKHFTKVEAEESSMTSVDRLGMQVRIKANNEFYSRRIGFIREVTNTEECRKVIVEMVKQARG
ncbi:MAG: pyridoxamine 5'-phosphate oxidase-related [Thermodesulfobacteriota bacterium]|nr:MAG: pyridoxamine 5'-phosphate oxidase-related [Thermodesulfobacteriota bacterium]